MSRWRGWLCAGAVGLGAGVWSTASATSFTGLGHLPGGEAASRCGAVSADGSVVVGWSGYEAFRWTAEQRLQGLGDLPGGDFQSRAPAVSADGAVVVGTSQSAPGQEAFVWTVTEGMERLGRLPGGASAGAANAVTPDGAVVVGQSAPAAGAAAGQAFRCTSSAGLQGLGVLPGQAWSAARGVDGSGTVVVGQSGDRAFVWDPVHGMRDLAAVLAQEHGLELAGWVLEDARGISLDGLTVAGDGRNPAGLPEAWAAHLDAWDAPGALPAQARLDGTYPNPFNPTTQIHFTLGRAAVVELSVYDLQGQRVARPIAPTPYEAGGYEVTFDGAGLASGTYLYRLQAGRLQQVGKMMLLK